MVGVSLEHTVVTAVTNVISVCIILGRVVHSWAVVLNLQRNMKKAIKLLKWVVGQINYIYRNKTFLFKACFCWNVIFHCKRAGNFYHSIFLA